MRSLNEAIAREIDFEVMSNIEEYFVCDPERQEWEPIVMTFDQWDTLTYQHTKRMMTIYKDKTGRFVGVRMKGLST